MSTPTEVLDHLHARIENLLDAHPPETWTVSEAAGVLDCLAGIAAAREAVRL